MKAMVDLLRGELERLFSAEQLVEMCRTFFDENPEENGMFDESKPVFIGRIVDWARAENALEALVDIAHHMKGDLLDARLVDRTLEIPGVDIVPGSEVAGCTITGALMDDGIGAAYRATSEQHGGVILYVVHSRFAQDEQALQRYIASQRILKNAEVPGALPVLSVDRLEDGRPYIVTPDWEQAPLAQERPESLDEALDRFASLLGIVGEFHDRGLVHGNLNLTNIFLTHADKKTELVVGGFGVDRLLVAPRQAVVGDRVAGIAPEQIRGENPAVASDVYALGAILFELVSGRALFVDEGAIDWVARHLLERPPRLSTQSRFSVPSSLDALAEQMLEKMPSQRPQTIAAVRAAFKQARIETERAAAQTEQVGTRDDINASAEALLNKPDDDAALSALTRNATEANAWSAAAEVIEEAAAKASKPERAHTLWLAAADAYAKHTRAFEKSAEIYDRLLGQDPHDGPALEGKLDLLHTSGNYDGLVALLAETAESTEDAGKKLEILLRIAAVYERDLGDYNRAFDYLIAIVSHGSVDQAAIVKLEELAAKTARFGDLASVLGQVAQAMLPQNAELAVFLYNHLGQMYWEKMGEQSFALSCFQQVMEVDRDNKDAIAAIAGLYKESGKWQEHAEMLMRLGEVETVPTLARGHRVGAARVFLETLKDAAKARELLEKVIASNPGHVGAVRLLSRILKDAEEWDRLVEVVSGGVDAMPEGAEQLELRMELASVHEEHFDNLAAAAEQYRQIGDQDPHRVEALEGLERIYTRKEEMAVLKENLEAQLKLELTPKRRVEVLEKLAGLEEDEFKDLATAADCYEKILEIDGRNSQALERTVALYRESEKWEELARSLETIAAITDDDEQKRAFYQERAEVIRDRIGDPARAADAFAKIAVLGEEDALVTLARTQVEAGEFNSAIETIEKIIDGSERIPQQLEMHLWLAQLRTDKLDDLSGAVQALRSAYDLSPSNADVLIELEKAYVASGNFAGALDVMEELFGLTEGDRVKSEIRSRMGVICEEQLDDLERAARFFAGAVELDENGYEASSRLTKIYRDQGAWDRALPIYERWSDAAGSLEPGDQVELFSHLGEAYDHLGRREDALKAFEKVAEIGADDLNVIRRLGEVALGVQEYALAAENLEKYLTRSGDTLQKGERVELLIAQGQALLGLEEADKAARAAKDAMALDDGNTAALVLLAHAQEQLGAFDDVSKTYQRLVQQAETGSEAWVSYVRKEASVRFEQLNDLDGASKLITEALEQAPADRGLLGDLLKVYSSAKRFGDVVDVVLRLAELVDDPRQKSRYFWTAAKIYRRELQNPGKATECFDKANLHDPSFAEARETLVELLKEQGDSDALERQYKKFIARLPKAASADDKLALYAEFAQLLIDERKNYVDGAPLLEALANLDRGNTEWLEKLADLYQTELGDPEKAVSVHRRLLAADPNRTESLRALFAIQKEAGHLDEAFSAVSVLGALGDLSGPEGGFREENLPSSELTFGGRLREDDWARHLVHAEVDQDVCAIFDVISSAVLAVSGHSLEDFGLSQDAADEAGPFVETAKSMANALALDMPPVYFKKDLKSDVDIIDTEPVALISRENLRDEKALRPYSFLMGRELGLLRPGFVVRQVVSSGTEMSAWLLAGLKAVVPTLPVPAQLAGKVTERMPAMRDLLASDAVYGERLKGHVQSFVANAADVDLKRWATAVDYSLDRVGLLASGDFVLAADRIRAACSDSAEADDRISELALFATSDEYHGLRHKIGVAISK